MPRGLARTTAPSITSACFSLVGAICAEILREARLQGLEDRRVAHEAPAQGRGRGLAREVVLGGPEAAGGDHEVGPGERGPEGRLEEAGVVGHGDPRAHFDAQLGEPLGDPEGVGVRAQRGQELAAHGEDLGPHQAKGTTRRATRSRRFA